jgi:serine/threonine protein kinase
MLIVAGEAAAEGTPFGRYRLIELLGRGGMGEVWRAHDTDTDRIVAIKVLPANLSEDAEFQRRFRREAHAAARLNSPHVIPIHHYGEIDGRLYLDMRLIKGRDLAAVLADGPLDPTRAVNIVGQVAKALHAAHEEGLLHRDIKPSNILLDRDDFAYLIDFGIARTIGETRMTQTGGAIGTFQYIAPERLAIGVDEDARADIYSLACVLYEALTGGPPFPGDTMPQLIAAHLNAPPPRPSITQPEVPPSVDEVIATGMAKEPDLRYATTIELADAARDAITAPVERPVSTPVRPPTEQAPSRVTRPLSPQPPAPPIGQPRQRPDDLPTYSREQLDLGTPARKATRREQSWWTRNPIAIAAISATVIVLVAAVIPGDVIYYLVSAILRMWYKAFAIVLGPSSFFAWALSVMFLVFTLRAILLVPFVLHVRKVRQLPGEHSFSGISRWLMLAQIPVFIGLYHVLRSFNRTTGGFGQSQMSVTENRLYGNYAFSAREVGYFLDANLWGAPIGASIPQRAGLEAFTDFSRPSVILVGAPVVILVGIATYFNSRASVARQRPEAAANPQTAMMNMLALYVFPIGVVLGGPFLPLGILLYLIANNIWTFGQQHFVFGRPQR